MVPPIASILQSASRIRLHIWARPVEVQTVTCSRAGLQRVRQVPLLHKDRED